MPRLLFAPRKDPVPIVQEVGRAPGPVWTGAENFAPTGIQTPDHLDHSQSLYRLRYPAHNNMDTLYINVLIQFFVSLHVSNITCSSSGRPFVHARTNGFPDDEHMMFETCRTHQELN